MNDDRRSYRTWLNLAKGKDVLFRHDVDFDIVTLERMLELEYEAGQKSVSYFDIHSPCYNSKDIKRVIDRFKDFGFMFGLHINTAYDYPPELAWKQYQQDVKDYEQLYGKPHSVVGHMYDGRIIKPPEYTNRNIEEASFQDPDMPDNFKMAFFPGIPPYMMSDSGGQLSSEFPVRDGRDFFTFDFGEHPAFVLLHPCHWRIDGDDVIFAKRLGGLPNTTQNIHVIQAKFSKRITTYCAQWLEHHHLSNVFEIIERLARENYREYFRVIDAGCAVGLLGMYLVGLTNIKYTGFDMNEDFINVGKEMFDALGFSPELIPHNLYGDVIPGDILVITAAEDLPMDYKKIYNISKNYRYIVITIVTKDRYDAGVKRGKKYWYIDHIKFEKMFGKSFDITTKMETNNRYLYLLTRKGK